jgi:hypothetical protein
MARRSNIDWVAIETEYRSGQFTVVALSDKHGVSRSTLNARIKEKGWVQDLTGAVKVATRAKLIDATIKQQREEARVERAAQKKAKESQEAAAINERVDVLAAEKVEQAAETIASGIDIAAAANVQVVMSHRRDLARLKRASFKMLGQLEEVTDNVPAVAELAAAVAENEEGSTAALTRFLSLTNRVANIEKLTASFSRIVTLERVAFGLDEDGKNKADTTVEEILRAAQESA